MRVLLFLGLSYMMLPVVSHAEIKQSVMQGQRVELYQVDDISIQFANLFYRLEGSQKFIQQPLSRKGSQWSAQLKGHQVRVPGIEYYVQLTYKNGSIKTDPPTHPEYNPERLSVNTLSTDTIHITNMKNNKNDSIEFIVNGYVDTETRVFMGDTDITDMMRRDNDKWTLENVSQLFDGPQSIQLVNTQGNTIAKSAINISNSDETPAAKNGEFVLRGSASFNIGGQSDDDSTTDESLVVTGNLHIETEYTNNDFSSHFSGVDVNYDHNADKEFDLSSGFLFTNSYKKTSLELGDVNVKGTPLVLSGFSRRGFVAATEGETWKGSVFNVRTSTVDGFESGISFDDRQTYGASYEQTIGDSGNTNIQISAVSGDLQQPETSNVGSANTNAQAGDTLGLLVSSEYAGVNINAELASSKFDQDTNDVNNAVSDEAYEVHFTKNIYGLASSLGYQHYGANYATIANPNFSGDREGLNLSFGSNWKAVSWTASLSSIEDNVDNDPLRPVVTSDNAGLSLDFVIENWPAINIGFNLTNQSSDNEPDATAEVDNKGHDVSLGLSNSFDAYNLAWSSSIGELNNKLDVTNDSETSSHSLTMGYNFDAADVNLNLSQNKNETDFILTSNLANLSLNIPLFSDNVVLNTQFSAQQNEADNNSQNNEIIGGSARVSWTLHDIIIFKSMDWVNPQFGISWTMNKTSDQIDSSLNESDSTIMFDFSFGAPISFEQRWQFDDET